MALTLSERLSLAPDSLYVADSIISAANSERDKLRTKESADYKRLSVKERIQKQRTSLTAQLDSAKKALLEAKKHLASLNIFQFSKRARAKADVEAAQHKMDSIDHKLKDITGFRGALYKRREIRKEKYAKQQKYSATPAIAKENELKATIAEQQNRIADCKRYFKYLENATAHGWLNEYSKYGFTLDKNDLMNTRTFLTKHIAAIKAQDGKVSLINKVPEIPDYVVTISSQLRAYDKKIVKETRPPIRNVVAFKAKKIYMSSTQALEKASKAAQEKFGPMVQSFNDTIKHARNSLPSPDKGDART